MNTTIFKLSVKTMHSITKTTISQKLYKHTQWITQFPVSHAHLWSIVTIALLTNHKALYTSLLCCCTLSVQNIINKHTQWIAQFPVSHVTGLPRFFSLFFPAFFPRACTPSCGRKIRLITPLGTDYHLCNYRAGITFYIL
jgi:hypothetical protein